MPKQRQSPLAWDIRDRMIETMLLHKKTVTAAEVEWARRSAVRDFKKEYHDGDTKTS